MEDVSTADAKQNKEANKYLDTFSPPSSISSLMSNSQYGQVIFHDIYDVYPTDCDLNFRLTVTETVKQKQGDRICLFKVGWKRVSEYVVYVLATIPISDNCTVTSRARFTASILPKDESELYQICYITFDEKLIGASTPFTFRRPLESDLFGVEDKANSGILMYKSRVAWLHDKIAVLEEEKELLELNIFTLNNKISVLTKELTSATTTNKDLTESLKNQKEDIDLLTENLKRVKCEYDNQKNFVKDRIFELNSANSKVEEVNLTLKNKEEELEKLRIELNEMKQVKCELNEQQIILKNRESELSDANSKCVEVNSTLDGKEKELQKLQMELNNVKQHHILANFTLKEVTDYNARLKEELDVLKQEKESLIANSESLKAEISRIRQSPQVPRQNEIRRLLQNQNSTFHEACISPSAPPAPGSSVPTTNTNITELQTKLDHALTLLDEALENQPDENRLKQIAELENKVKEFSEAQEFYIQREQLINTLENQIRQLTEEKVKYSSIESYVSQLQNEMKQIKEEKLKCEDEIQALSSAVTKQYEEIRNMSDELMELRPLKEQILHKDKDIEEKTRKLNRAEETAMGINQSVMIRINDLENELSKNKTDYETENNRLKNKIIEFEKMHHELTKKEELEEIVKCLKAALISEPCFEEFCKIIFESTRITAKNTYKDLFTSLQFLDFENLELGSKVRRLLDEFGIILQDLERCRLEIETINEDREKIKNDFTKVNEENEIHKNKIVELNEIISEMSNCLDAVKKDNSETQHVKELQEDLEKLKIKKEQVETELKEARIANALINIGRITFDQSTEVERLRSKVTELEAQLHCAPGYQKCCIKMQDQLKKSAKEYAKLYRQLETEREHYQKLLSTVNEYQCPTKSPVDNSPTN